MRVQLFRVKVFPLPDPVKGTAPMGAEDFSPAVALRARVEEKPKTEKFAGAQWHVGNVRLVGDDGMYFVIGRDLLQDRPKFREDDDEFVVEQEDVSPFTHVLLDVPYGVCAIAENRAVAESPLATSKHLARILDKGMPGTVPPLQFVVLDLTNPDEFLGALRNAYRIKSLTLRVTRANSFDAERDFLGPLSRAVTVADASTGTATFAGNAIAADRAEELVRSISGTADTAKAKLQMEEGEPVVIRNLKENPATLEVPDLQDRSEHLAALGMVRVEYLRIRQGEQDERS